MNQSSTHKRDLHQQARLSRLANVRTDLTLHNPQTAAILDEMLKERQQQIQQERKEATA